MPDHLIVRLADEGIPIGAICRATKRPRDEVLEIVEEARQQGQIVEVPASDWPVGSRRGGRAPVVSPRRTEDLDELLMPLMRLYGLTLKQATVLGCLLRGSKSKPTLHRAISGDEAETVPKIVDVIICTLRKKLLPFELQVETIWGRGYSLVPESARTIVAAVAEHNKAFGILGADPEAQSDGQH